MNSLLAIIVALILVIAYILYTYDTQELKKAKTTTKNIQKTIEKKITEVEEKSEEQINKYVDNIEIKKDQFEEYTKDLYEEYIDKDIIDTTKKKIEDKKEQIEETNQVKQKDKKEQIEEKIIVKKIKEHETLPIQTNKPKLAIVIDDVTTQYQINQINSIGYRTTISVMPPTPDHKNSAKIAQDLPFYMIHFPMEATTYRGEEKHTLHVGDSYETIENRVAQIRKWYPNAKYTNNHTGSKFTENEEGMDNLFRALKKHDFIFMDSRTTSKTLGKKMAKKYNMPYIVRNVFLDNEQDFSYIQNQLKKAIKIAKKNGHAIAICHPHSITIKVLKQSKHLLKDLELIYLNQLPFLNK
ncbi:divergent polysaccharide deacetylase family protein [Arcobacter sp. LA11]|uniref:divergent polysaccharide deacetylase family protein n=1 Tax=Arcobacter sp. LA11 TaxID=1898176 RepID=UPI001576F3BB|nr:divergent polysaccharide deacetylase family protein [Arcobacter sp. LA11]